MCIHISYFFFSFIHSFKSFYGKTDFMLLKERKVKNSAMKHFKSLGESMASRAPDGLRPREMFCVLHDSME